MSSSGGTTHTITSASPADNGVYQCHWYSQQLGTFVANTWGLVITNPGKNNFEVVKLCENGICLKCAVIHSYKDSVFFV